MPSWQQRVFFRPKHRGLRCSSFSRAHVVLRTVRRRVDGDPRPQNRSNRSCIISFFLCLHLTCSSHCYIPLSLFLSLSLFIFLFLSIALTRSIYHRPSGFLVPTPLRPWPRCVLEQEEPIALLAPLAAPVTSVHARREMQAVHIVVPRRPDADCRVVHSDKSTRGRN